MNILSSQHFIPSAVLPMENQRFSTTDQNFLEAIQLSTHDLVSPSQTIKNGEVRFSKFLTAEISPLILLYFTKTHIKGLSLGFH
jgi:hypothetical protein